MINKWRVPGAGLEPARPCEHMPLKHACLPVSAPGLISNYEIWTFPKFKIGGKGKVSF